MKQSIHRRKFLLVSGLAVAGAFCPGAIETLCAADASERLALDFIRRYSDNFLVRRSDAGVTRITAEVRDLSKLGAAFQSARRSRIARLDVVGTLSTFKIGDRTFEVDSLCPAEFAAQNS